MYTNLGTTGQVAVGLRSPSNELRACLPCLQGKEAQKEKLIRDLRHRRASRRLDVAACLRSHVASSIKVVLHCEMFLKLPRGYMLYYNRSVQLPRLW